ncbi:putative nucleus protein [Naematelia encephala]|uniref:Putative nucleus protein n=1 Tax=Naematelia encephala TaxID=71784 RepID=A0A1Y2AXJ8_9TREE|nr:putative nucleus protein [Naematelia encephala]
MARGRESSPSNTRDPKRARIDTSTSKYITLPTGDELSAHREQYAQAVPYKYAAIGGLLSDELLEGVVEESRTYGPRGEEGSLPGWGWEQKETDIYKIQQTPDLSSLDPEHLPDETLASLPQLTKLKDALYSQEFRDFVRQVTGCGPLSGKKTDGSVGLYTEGSHLLLHDDSISTRLISYILYLPNSPADAPSTSSASLTPSANGSFLKGWDPAWGGSLELYPVESGEDVGVPGVKRSGKVDVKWGQLVFFEVRPGRSYHSVEEVIVGDGRQRLGVSGWFHRPMEGEQGYEAIDAEKVKQDLSSLAQITSAPTIPFIPYSADPPVGLTPSHISFLAPYLAPSYLTPATLEKLSGQFVEASEIVLHNFLHPDLAAKLKAETESADRRDYPDGSILPAQETGEGDGWVISGPTSKHRYLSLQSATTSTPTIESILNTLLPSEAFRAWLSVVSSLAPTARRTEARRFRRGLDYTLAAGEERSGEARLDVWLGATWWADVQPGTDEDDALADHGGWEAYIAAPDESEDPAVFQSALAKKGSKEEDEPKRNGADEEITDVPVNGAPSASNNSHAEENKEAPVNGKSDPSKTNGPSISLNGTELEFDPDQFSPSDFDSDSEDGDEDDGPLLMQAVSYNKLLLVLRDPGVMRFVKYLSAGAEGSRWDVGGEWAVGIMEAEEDDDE